MQTVRGRPLFIQSKIVSKRGRRRVRRWANGNVLRKYVSLEIFSVPVHHHYHRDRRRRRSSPGVTLINARRGVVTQARCFKRAKAITARCQVLKISIPLARVRGRTPIR